MRFEPLTGARNSFVEAYFAELLAKEARALRVYDRFVEMHYGEMRYCLAMEFAEHGDLGAWLAKKGPQSERFVRREIAAILCPLDALHRGLPCIAT